jgi:quercetin dioxygenase-like cupin family protein
MDEGAVAPALRSVAERAIALAATGAWSSADRLAIIDSLKALGPLDASRAEIGEGGAAHATVFTLGRGGVLPLHDHPAMTVICKVLRGRMRVETFEWVDPEAGLARELGTREIDETSDPVVFGPEPGTLHRITALADCAFIDLFAPYYDDERPCRYYRPVDAGGGTMRLEPTGEIAP